MKNLSELEKKYQEASDTYYNSDTTTMTDSEFDKLREKIKSLNPDSPVLKEVGYSIPEFSEAVTHKIVMGSLNKAKDERALKLWWSKKVGPKHSTIATYKMDGSSLELIYKDGQFTQAITRGDGHVGEDVTENVKRFKNIPNIIKNFNGSIRGEAIMHLDTFEKYFKDKSNPRNTSAGIIRRKTDKEDNKHLSFYAFELLPSGVSYQGDLDTLEQFGFDTTNYAECVDTEGAIKIHQDVTDNRENLNFEIDGLVFRINDHKHFHSAGSRDERPKGAIAYKFDSSAGTSTLDSVEFSIGHTGTFAPIAKIKPVSVGGVTISSVLLSNMEEISRLGVYINDKVRVIRAGDVIPKITGVIQKMDNRVEIKMPSTCPSCNTKIEKIGANHFCTNYDCPARALERIKNWVKKLNIKHLGTSVIDSLYAQYNINIHDLYDLKSVNLAKLDLGKVVLGQKRADKIISEIDKTRVIPLENLIGSLGIPLLGRRTAKKLISHGLDSAGKFLNASLGDLLDTKMFNKDPSKRIYEGLKLVKKELKILNNTLTIKAKPDMMAVDGGIEMWSEKFKHKTFVFTGAIQRTDSDGNRFTRTKLMALCELNGGIPAKAITHSTDYLVQADPSSQSSKTRKAKGYGVEILSEDEFFNISIPSHIQMWEQKLKEMGK